MSREAASGIIGLLWLSFWIYWLVSATKAKKNARRSYTGILVRVIILVIVLVAILGSGHSVRFESVFFVSSPYGFALGIVLVALGLAFAVWARVHLGRNWGMPMSLKEEPELVTSGPYRFVRHPIYTGVLLAILGSALVAGTLWLVVFVAASLYFIYSAKQEEKIMLKEFPEHYAEYMVRSKMLIPFVL